MLCQTTQGKQFYSLPKPLQCFSRLPNKLGSEQSPSPASVIMYKCNHVQYRSIAWACKKAKYARSTFTYFFADEHLLKENKKPLPVGAEECERMKSWKSCSAGALAPKGDLFQTSNTPDLSYPSGGNECCKWRTISVENCYMYKAMVYKQHDSKDMESTAGPVSHCNYSSGKCQLKDGTFLLWDPDKRARCEFLPWRKLKGERFGDNWLASDGTMALTFHDKQTTTDCEGQNILMSDQGIAFRYSLQRTKRASLVLLSAASSPNRTKRQNPSNRSPHWSIEPHSMLPHSLRSGGIVSSAQLASALQAVTFELRKSIRFAFSQAMHVACNSMNMIIEVLKADILANPTLTMRTILKRPNILARAGGHTIEIWPCEAIPDRKYRFLSMNNTCTQELPIGFEIHGQYHQGYLDPVTNILQQTAFPTDCTLNKEVPVLIDDSTYVYNRETGSLSLAPKPPPLQIVRWNSSLDLPQETIIFRQVVMYNWSEIRSHVTLNDLLGTLSAQRQLFAELGVNEHGSPQEAAIQTVSGIMTRGFFGFLKGLTIDWWQVWVFFCCLYVSVGFVLKHCCPQSHLPSFASLPDVISKTRQWYHERDPDPDNGSSQARVTSISSDLHAHAPEPPMQPRQTVVIQEITEAAPVSSHQMEGPADEDLALVPYCPVIMPELKEAMIDVPNLLSRIPFEHQPQKSSKVVACPLLIQRPTPQGDHPPAPATVMIRAEVSGVPLAVGLDSFSEICAIDRHWANANLLPFQASPGFAEAEASLVTLAGTGAPVPEGPDLMVEVLGVTMQLHLRIMDFPDNFPVPCLLGTEFFRRAGPVTINLNRNSVRLHDHEEFFLPPEVVNAYYCQPERERPCIRGCPHRRFPLNTPAPIPAGLPDIEDRRFRVRPRAMDTLQNWLREVLPIQSFGFSDDIRGGRFNFVELHKAYQEVIGKESLRLCRCHLFEAFYDCLLSLKADSYYFRI